MYISICLPIDLQTKKYKDASVLSQLWCKIRVNRSVIYVAANF